MQAGRQAVAIIEERQKKKTQLVMHGKRKKTMRVLIVITIESG